MKCAVAKEAESGRRDLATVLGAPGSAEPGVAHGTSKIDGLPATELAARGSITTLQNQTAVSLIWRDSTAAIATSCPSTWAMLTELSTTAPRCKIPTYSG